MLDKFRKKKNIKIIMFFIAIIIVPAFMLWGVGSVLKSKGKDSLAGLVFSKKIPKDDFVKQYHAVYNQAQMLYGENLNKVKDLLNLEGQTWQRIILLEEARRRKIKISDAEVIAAIQSSPIFQKNNAFSKDSYETTLKYYLGLRPQQYEAQTRDNLKIKTLIEQVTEGVEATEIEAWEKFKSEKSSFKLSYILIKPTEFLADITHTEEELGAFYGENRERFKKEEQVNLECLGILFKDLATEATVLEEEIDNYFKEHEAELEEMQSKEESRLSDEDLRAKISDYLIQINARDKAQELIWQIENDIASETSLSQIAEKSNLSFNETGFFSPWDPIPEIGWAYKITEQAFSLNPGEISSAMETKNGFYIIKLIEKRASYIPEFDEAKESVLKEYIASKSNELAKKEAEELLSSIILALDNEEDIQTILAANALEFIETDFITSASYIKGIGNASDILTALDNSQNKGFNPKVITSQAGYIVLRIDDIKEVVEEEFKEQKDKLQEELLTEKKNAALNDWFNQIREDANLEVYFTLPK
ncbi:MAG: SurA N-terminal domain-containing protein [Candidatus Kaelpia aquatica]|nr:SurA N-terminal domain-containing protein [Candidatus Kaelpia aquatica]